MSYSWTTNFDCYRAQIKTDFPAGSVVYRSKMIMAHTTPVTPLNSGIENWGDVTSSNVIVVGKDGKYLLAGAITAYRSLSVFRAVYENRKIVAIEMIQPEIKPDETPEETVILEGDDWRELLVRYADIAAEKNNIPEIKAEKNITGYCTWYYYYKDVTQANTIENIDALAKNRYPYAAEYVQIDDGYQTFQGDWLDQCESWPTPLEEVAKKIIASGMKAGIWLMPATASMASRVYKNHPDWFVKNQSGQTVALPGWTPPPDNLWACLDTTIPEVREHIAGIFKTFRSWGFTYFKLDGLYYGLQRGVRQDPNATSVSAFRLLLKTIREAVPDAVIMGCTEPMLPCLGLIDNGRVSNDTSRYFHPNCDNKNGPVMPGCSIADAFHESLADFWLFDRWFRADPDVVMARQDNAFYTRNQAKISILGGIMTGISFTSDHLGTIDTDRNILLAKAQNIRMRNVRPMTFEPNTWPMTFEGTIDGKRAVAVVNDTPQTRVWTMDELGMPQECFDLLDEKNVTYNITLTGEDAVLLVER